MEPELMLPKNNSLTVRCRGPALNQFAVAIALCMGCCTSDLAGDQLYEDCLAGPALQGSCAPGLVCTQIGATDGPHCFERATASGGCLESMDEPYMGLVCAPSCTDSSTCPAGLQCFPPGAATGWCVPP